MTQPPRLLGARGAPPRSQQPAPLSPCGQISTLGQLPRINAEKPPGFAVQQEELEALAELCWPSPHICTPGLGVPTAFGHRSHSAQPLRNPQPSTTKQKGGESHHMQTYPPPKYHSCGCPDLCRGRTSSGALQKGNISAHAATHLEKQRRDLRAPVPPLQSTFLPSDFHSAKP